jgi:ribosome-associated protein
MAIKKYHRNRGEEDYTSKTSIKLDAKAIKKFGQELVELTALQLEALPVLEVTLKALLDHQKMTTNLARKRHFLFIGKCLRKENLDAIKEAIEDSQKVHFKKKTTEKIEVDPADIIIKKLVEDGDVQIEKLISDNESLDRQTLRQILRNIKNSKTAVKKQQAVNKMKAYLA